MQEATPQSLEEQWLDQIDRFATELCESCDEEQLHPQLTWGEIEAAVRTLVETAVSMSTFDWEKESPCPHCGRDMIERYFEGSEKVNHYEDSPSKSKGMHRSTEINGFRCYDCETWIQISPKSLLMRRCSEYDLSENEVLQQALRAHIEQTYPDTNGDYERGSVCTDCTRRDVVETQLYSESITPCGNGVDFHGDVQPVEPVSLRCDGCGHQRGIEPIAMIPMTLES